MARIFDTLDADNIISLYSKGNSLSKIGEMIGVNPMTVRKVLTLHGVHIRSKSEQTYAELCNRVDVEGILSSYANGVSTNKIRAMFGIGETQINLIFKFNNIRKRSKGEQGRINGIISRENRLNGDEIERLYRDGIGIVGIANKMNVAASVIANLLKHRGVHIRNRSEQQFARMARTTTDERKRLVKKANEAVRGNPLPVNLESR